MRRRAFLKNAALFSGTALARPRFHSLAGMMTADARDGARSDNPPPRSKTDAKFKIGAISDGFSGDFEQALQIMKGYGLHWVEIREVWGKYNTEATPAEIQRIRHLLDQYDFKCSAVDSALYKCTLPGTKPVGTERDAYAYSGQMDLLKRAADRAHAWGTDKVRGFSFWRVAEPPSVFTRVAAELEKAAGVARTEGVRLVIENEESCNGCTGHELAAILKLAPAQNLGINWDVGNGYMHGEVSYPAGYDALDKSRIWHLHLKGMACGAGLKDCKEAFADQGVIDLAGQLRALERNHYDGTMSLECEFRAPGMTHEQTSRRSLEGLLRIVHQAAPS
ncbi:MAG TPA: sugar phosphate isomerase/epimerase family protein [Terriglobia bacterium]|nr:sugar phosphate isomerase/epimerase family protein [Terriglobia bacterium]